MIDRASPDSSLLERDPASPGAARVAAIDESDDEGLRAWKPTGAARKERLDVHLMRWHQIDQTADRCQAHSSRLGNARYLSAPAASASSPPPSHVGIDADAGVIAEHVEAGPLGFRLVHADARQWLREHRWETGTLVYADPPYLGSARSSRSRPVYRHELLTEEEHRDLLELLTSIPALVMISGYGSALYERVLSGWWRVEYTAMTRGGPVTEVVWMNYPAPQELHDYRYLGEDFHDRCRIARKIERWRRKLAGLPALERAAVIAGIGVPAGA